MEKLSDNDKKKLGEQLRRPHGEIGMEVGDYMSVNNANMIEQALAELATQENEAILEIGFGNGAHVSNILKLGDHISYTGIDISELMVEKARKINSQWIDSGRARFQYSDGKTIPFEDGQFDGIFSVNTIYFWEQPVKYLREMYRVLKPRGRLILAFAAKSFLEKMEAQQIGFQIYDLSEIEKMMSQIGFDHLKKELHSERVSGKFGENMERQFVVMKGVKL